MITGRCYCGAVRVEAAAAPLTVAYCHCTDCRRWTGAPVAAFAAFDASAVQILPDPGPVTVVPGVDRWFCRICGSPLAARFDYLPGQIYVPLGILDQAAEIEPQMHAHADAQLPWLHLADGLPREAASARGALNASEQNPDAAPADPSAPDPSGAK
ncbi:MAG: GFA family protein [Pseudomonadota bacterium]